MNDKKSRMGAMFGGETGGGLLDLARVDVGSAEGADIVVMGAPCATPYRSVGPYCAGAPDAIRGAFGWPGVLDHFDFDLNSQVLPAGIRAVDWGNLDWDEQDFASNRENIRTSTSQVLDAGAVPLIMGGDDSVPIPVLEAYKDQGPLVIFQLDAHIDWRDNVDGETLGLSSNMRRASEMPWVEQIIQVGARGMGSARPSDHQDALDWGVNFFPMADIISAGLQPLIDAVPEGSRVYIAFDIDAMDPAVVPSVIGPAPGGFDYWQILALLNGIAARARIAGFNLVELMPDNDIGGRGALVAARIMAVMLHLVGQQR